MVTNIPLHRLSLRCHPKKYSTITLLIFLAIFCSGCRDESAPPAVSPSSSQPKTSTPLVADEQSSTTNEGGIISTALDALKDGASKVQDAVQPYASPLQDTATASVQKLIAIDYRLVEIPHETSIETIELTLNQLGTERWDCSSMPPSNTSLRFLCKRLPMNAYLKAFSLVSKLSAD
jgi:hypothetical protein